MERRDGVAGGLVREEGLDLFEVVQELLRDDHLKAVKLGRLGRGCRRRRRGGQWSRRRSGGSGGAVIGDEDADRLLREIRCAREEVLDVLLGENVAKLA